jgi:serine/threonine-protein kinase
MAPEQAEGKSKEIGRAADVYSLGAILYELMTGRPPFKAATTIDTLMQVISDEPVPPSRLQPKTPRDLETICLKCLHKETSHRYATAHAMAEDLRRFRQGEPIVARPVGRLERSWMWAKRRPMAAAAWGLAATAAALLALGGTLLWLWSKTDAAKRATEAALLREAEARQSEAEATRQADEARTKLRDLERTRRREQAQNTVDRVTADLPNLRRRALWSEALSRLAQTRALLELDIESQAADQLALRENEIRLLARLDDIRMRKAALAAAEPERVWNAVDIRKAYENAFHDGGFDFSGANRDQVVEAATRKLAASPIKDELLVFLDDWAWLVKDEYADAIWETTARATGQEWRRDLRFTSVSAPDALRLSREVPIKHFSPAIVCGLGFTMRLFLSGDKTHATRWLEAGANEYPDDFWVNFYLGIEYLRLREPLPAAGAFRAAVAIRPQAPLARNLLHQCLEEAEKRRLK